MFNVHPYLGKIPILTHIFQLGWFNHQLDINYIYISLENHTDTRGGNVWVAGHCLFITFQGQMWYFSGGIRGTGAAPTLAVFRWGAWKVIWLVNLPPPQK